MKPFLKWAGGKRWLVRKHPELFDHDYRRYVEPFLGSGAVFFHMEPQKSWLSDLNGALINLYICLQNDFKQVFHRLRRHARFHGDAYYYSVRDQRSEDPFARAAQFLYLNRTCWNGLYRENLRGKFNVPRGTKDTVVFEDDDFEAISTLLHGATVDTHDFEVIVAGTGEGDFVFVDPPYTVRHNANGFIKYNEKIFSWSDQIRLAEVLRRKADCGATYLVSNALHPSVVDLYQDFATILPVRRTSVLAAGREFRGPTQEALFCIGAGWHGRTDVIATFENESLCNTPTSRVGQTRRARS